VIVSRAARKNKHYADEHAIVMQRNKQLTHMPCSKQLIAIAIIIIIITKLILTDCEMQLRIFVLRLATIAL